MTTTADLRVPIQTPLMDEHGNLTRPWILFLQGLIPTNNNATAKTGRARINFLDFIPTRLHAAIAAGTCAEPLQVYMQTAIDALHSQGGGIIDLPGGTYPLGDGNGLLLTENATIVGDGDIRSIVTYSGAGSAIQIGDDTRLRDRMGLRDMQVRLVGAGPQARGVTVISSLIVNLERIEIQTDQQYMDPANEEWHTAYDQVGLLLHGGTWGSLRGLVSITGKNLTWTNGDKFGPWFAPGASLFLNGTPYTVETYTDDTHLTLTEAPGDSAEREYVAFAHGFTAFFYWRDCFIRGLFKTGLRGTGRTGWGVGSSHLDGGGIIWTWPIPPPEQYGYYGVHCEAMTAKWSIVNVENYDVCMRSDDVQELFVPRFEGYGRRALWLTDAGPNNCTIDGDKLYAVYATGTFVQVHNIGSAPVLTDALIGKSITIDKAGANYAPHTTTITAVNPNGIECTIADPCSYYALHDYYGGANTRIFSGNAYSMHGGVALQDDTGGRYSSCLTLMEQAGATQQNFQGVTNLRGHAFIRGNYSLTWTEVGGSTLFQWQEAGLTTARVGVYGDRKLNVAAGIVKCQECAGTILSGSTELHLTVYPGQIAAIEPSAAVLGQRIVIEKALDGRRPLDTTIVDVLTTGALHSQGKIDITTTTVYTLDGPVQSTVLDGIDTAWTVALHGKMITINGAAYRFVYSSPDRGFIDMSTPYPGADEQGASYSIAYNTYSFTLAAGAGASVTDAFVRFGDADDDWLGERAKDIAFNANGSLRFAMGNVEKMRLDTNGLALYDHMRLYGNKGISWSTLGASAGLGWTKPDPEGGLPLNYGQLVNQATGYLSLQAGEPRIQQHLIIHAAHPDAEIRLRVDGDDKLIVSADGVIGIGEATLAAVALTGNSTAENLSVAQWLKIENNTVPLLIFRNTHATSRSQGIDFGWGGLRQWLVATGVPSGGVEALTVTEYTDDVFADVRLMIARGGNVLIGSTTDDGTRLQVAGGAKFTGVVTVGSMPALQLASNGPFIITRNTDPAQKGGGFDMGWDGKRQWLFSAGVPNQGNTGFSITEYTDDVYQGVRLMVHKGGNLTIGSTTDDGANILQVTGNAKVTGALAVTGALTVGSFSLSSPLPIASGGTGAADAAAARLALGVDLAPMVMAGTVNLPKITTTGAYGWITVNANGRVTGWSSPT